jgi:hypothetical protein
MPLGLLRWRRSRGCRLALDGWPFTGIIALSLLGVTGVILFFAIWAILPADFSDQM